MEHIIKRSGGQTLLAKTDVSARMMHGEWHIALELEAGRSCCFRNLVNGEEWMDDDHADDLEPNVRGGFDSVVRS